MRASRVWGWEHGARAMWLGALLLAAGCATVPAPPGSDVAYLQRARRRELALTWGWVPGPQTQQARTDSGRPQVPEGWPEEASGDEELLAPFLACRSVGEFLALQRAVDMGWVVERLGDWNAVRLGALGPLADARVSQVLTRKRASFLLKATQDYGASAQVFALFIVHTAFDDELDGLLRLLARDKQLSQTLGHMEAVRQELEALQRVAWQVAERLGVEGLGELARYIRASREAAVFVGAGGEPTAVALYEARGNVSRAQAWLSEARPERAGVAEPRAATGAPSGLAALVDEAAGYSAEVVEAKLQQAELEALGPRLPADVTLLTKLRATLTTPPPGVPEGYVLWEEYLTYRQRRLTELEQGGTTEGPLRWEAYEREWR